MVSRFGAWLNKKFTNPKDKQPNEDQDVPEMEDDMIQQLAATQDTPSTQQFAPYGEQPQQREARFSARGERSNRDSMKQQARKANNTDRRKSGALATAGQFQPNLMSQNRTTSGGSLATIQSTGLSSQTSNTAHSPVKRARQPAANRTSGSAAVIDYEPGELPPDFHRRVVDLEIKVEMHGVSQNDNEGQIKLLSDLMQLYSAAIEHYNRTRDEENYAYYIEKLQKLNAQIRVLIEREERQLDRMKVKKKIKQEEKKAKREVAKAPVEAVPDPTKPTVAKKEARPMTMQNPLKRTASIQPKKLNYRERHEMKNAFQMALNTRKEEENTEQTQEQLEQQIVQEKMAKQKVETDLVNQKDRLQQRLAERKRSKAFRATSQTVNQTLPLNFVDQAQKDISGTNLNVGPMMQTSAMGQGNTENNKVEESPLYKSQTLRVVRIKDDDTFSQGNRSTTTQGGGLANKIGQAVSRILSQSANLDQTTDEDDVSDLVNLLNELNNHHDLTVKLSNQSKIMKFLNEATDAANQAGPAAKAAPTVKDYKVTIGKAKSEFGRLGFQAKMKLEMKQMMIDPKVKEIVDQSRQKLEELQQQKDEDIEEFQEEHAEAKYKANQKVKQKYKVQIALASKQKDTEKKQALEIQQKEALKEVEKDMAEKGVAGKNTIKERFNELAKQVTIDTSGFVTALLKKKEIKRQNSELSPTKQSEAEEHKIQKQDSLTLPDTIEVGIAKQASPRFEEQNTDESTPTPTQKKQNEQADEGNTENMLDSIDRIDL